MQRQDADDIFPFLFDLPLDPELREELERCRPGWRAWLSAPPAPVVEWRQVRRGLQLLARGSAGGLPSEAALAADYDLVAAAPRPAALSLLFVYLLRHAHRFNLSLLPWLRPLEESALPLTRVVARLAVLAAGHDLDERAAARGLGNHTRAEAVARIRDLAFTEPGGVFVADLPDLAYDLRLTRFDHQGYSFSLQSFYASVSGFAAAAGPPLVLPLDGARFDADGYLSPPDHPDPPAWTAGLRRSEQRLEGNGTIGEDGLGRRGEVHLSPGGQARLQPGDDAVEMHVEPGGDLSPEAFAAALEAALAHYHRHFPEWRPRAVFMVSWLLDPVLATLLPPTSRIRRFQSLFRLYPARYDEAYARDCVMAQRVGGRLTALQRAVMQLEAAGGTLKEGGGFRLLP